MRVRRKEREHWLTQPDMFRCSRWECLISKKDCLKRQQQKVVTLKNYWGSKTQAAFPECQGCLQGLRIRLEETLSNASEDSTEGSK